jgi:hypothetical protein
MKNVRFASVMLIGMMLLICPPLFSAVSSELQLRGLVSDPESLLGVEIVPNENADNLDLLIQDAQPVGIVSVSTIDNISYTVTVTSVNGFYLVQNTQDLYKIPYTLQIDGNELFSPGSAGGMFAEQVSANQEWNVAVYINNPPTGDFPEGFYQDILTFSVQAN